MMRTERTARWLALTLAVLLVSTAFVGCPRPGPDDKNPNLSVETSSLVIDPAEDTGTVPISNTGGANLNWSASVDKDWVEVLTPSGTNDGTLQFQVDRSALGPGEHVATITIESDGGIRTVSVTITVDGPTVGAYWPFAVGNTWSFTAAAFSYEEEEDWGEPWEEWKSFRSDETFLVLTIADRTMVDGREVWQVNVLSPHIDLADMLFPVPYDPYEDDYYFYTSSAPMRKLMHTIPVPMPNGFATYWVSSGSDWRIALTPDAAAQAEPGRFVTWSQFEGLLAKGLYTVLSRDGQDFVGELGAIEGRLAEDLEPIGEDLMAYMDDVYMGHTEDLMALLMDYGAAFGNYTSDSVLLTSLTRISATIASGVPKLEHFMDDALAIAMDFDDLQYQYGDALYLYMDELYEDDQPLVDMLHALGADFRDYEHQEALIQDVVRICAVLASNARDMSDFTFAAADIIAEAQAQLDDEFWDDYYDYYDPQGEVEMLEAFQAAFAAYTNPDPVLQGFGRMLAATSGGAATVGRNQATYTEEDHAALEQFMIEAALFVESRGVEAAIDPVLFLDDLANYLAAYDADSQAVEDAIAFMQGVIPHLRAVIVELQDSDGSLPDRRDVFQFVSDMRDFFASYAAANPDDLQAYMLAVQFGAIDDVLDLAEFYLGGMLDDLRTEFEALLANLEAIDEVGFDPANHEALMLDLHAWFAAYATLNPDDALAAYMREVTGLTAEFMGLVGRDLGWVFDDLFAQLGDLVHDVANLPENDLTLARVETLLASLSAWGADYGTASGDPLAIAIGLFTDAGTEMVSATDAYLALLEGVDVRDSQGALSDFMPVSHGPMGEVTLDDIAVGDQPDCVAREVWVEDPEGNNYWLPTVIYGRDLGLIMAGPLTLEHAVVDGVEYGD